MYEICPFCHDATDGLVVVPVWLARTASVLCLFAAPCYILARRQNGLPPVFALGAFQAFGVLLVDEEFPALDTAATQNLEDHFVELDIVYGTRQLEVPEMAGTSVVVETAGPTDLAVL